MLVLKCFKKNIYVNNINMLYYDRIDVSQGTDVDKTSVSKECVICFYWHYLNKGFKFQPDGCHDFG